ncbi:PREDICTED: sulfotransferase 1C4-like [Branchiostoma belcheri]|uniref:Sulfotransferase n=1 Tax=Branchiostoma belcheri TaxID=7741 RepID=A0A6P5AIR2_BRABE|nr:PREDICTED: sulfotransferase 1C4-like [Branchiostoma belcheri]
MWSQDVVTAHCLFAVCCNKRVSIPFRPTVTKESLDAIPDYVIRDDDVAIVTYPRAGTNWTIEIVNRLQRAAGKTDVAAEDIAFGIEVTLPGFGKPGHVILKDQPSPRIIHTHLPWHLAPKMISSPKGKVKVIVVMRNPKDTVVSLYRFLRKLEELTGIRGYTSWEDCVQGFLNGKALYGDFYDHALGWWQMRDDPHFLFLKYEDMKKDLSGAVRRVKEFLNISLDDVTTSSIVESCSFVGLKSSWADSRNQIKRIVAWKGVIGEWRKSFSSSQNEAYDDKYRDRLEGTGLQFDFD